MFLAHKHDTFTKFEIFCRRVQREEGHFITNVHSDHGGDIENKVYNVLKMATHRIFISLISPIKMV